MTRRFTDEDIEALKSALVEPLTAAIEQKLAERFYTYTGKGIFAWLKKLWQPIIIALIIYGLSQAPNLPQTVAEAVRQGH